MTNEIETVTNALPIANHITPQAAAYNFKEWFGVIGSCLTAAYTAAHVVFNAVVRAGGVRVIIAEFVGKWPDGFTFWKQKIATSDAPAPKTETKQ